MTRYKNVTTTHDPDDLADFPGSATDVSCTVTGVDTDGYLTSGRCTTPHYPGQAVTVDDNAWCPEDFGPYVVGQVVADNYCYSDDGVDFHPYRTTTKVGYQAKSLKAKRTLRTAKHAVSVKDGGERLVFSGNGGTTTDTYAMRKGWKVHWSFDCSDFGSAGNFQLELESSNFLDTEFLSNALSMYGSGSHHIAKSGRYDLWINTECDWTVTVTGRR